MKGKMLLHFIFIKKIVSIHFFGQWYCDYVHGWILLTLKKDTDIRRNQWLFNVFLIAFIDSHLDQLLHWAWLIVLRRFFKRKTVPIIIICNIYSYAEQGRVYWYCIFHDPRRWVVMLRQYSGIVFSYLLHYI